MRSIPHEDGCRRLNGEGLLDCNEAFLARFEVGGGGEDAQAPSITGGIQGRQYEGTARDDRADDTGIASVTLGQDTNLALAVAPFSVGDGAVDFTITLVDARQQGEGFVVATDAAGNSAQTWVCSNGCPPPDDPPPPPGEDTTAPVVSGSIERNRFAGDATDSGSGIASVVLGDDAVNLRLSVDPFSSGDASVGFTVRLQNPRQPGSGTVVAIDVEGNEGTTFIDSERRVAEVRPASTAALPEAVTLAGAYPNPFAEQATIRFGLPSSGPTAVTVQDLLGREVARLADGHMEAGWHEVAFEGPTLPSGTYLVRLTSASGTQTQRVTLMR